jgi:hypothetical protein
VKGYKPKGQVSSFGSKSGTLAFITSSIKKKKVTIMEVTCRLMAKFKSTLMTTGKLVKIVTKTDGQTHGHHSIILAISVFITFH